MKNSTIRICWPNDTFTEANEGDDWFIIAKKANIDIPTGCMSGNCGACEIDVNGKTIRPCMSNLESSNKKLLNIEFNIDPYWT